MNRTSATKTDLDIEPLHRDPAISDRIVSKLLGLVRAGNLKPGDGLPSERDLSASFGVSRPIIREAIRALAVLGVVRIRHGGRTYVSSLDAADLLGPLTFFLALHDVEVEKLYAARRLVEGELARLAAEHASSKDVSKLRELVAAQLQASGDPSRFRELDSEFHGLLSTLADNSFLTRTAESLNILGLEFRKQASETPAVIKISVRDHDAIVEAIARRDAAAAKLAMEAHMQHVLETTQRAHRTSAGRQKRK